MKPAFFAAMMGGKKTFATMTKTPAAGTGSNSSDRAFVTVATSTITGKVREIWIGFDASSTVGASCKALLFDVSGGTPNNLLDVSAAIAIPAGASTQVFTMPSGIAIASGTQYGWGLVANDFHAVLLEGVLSGTNTYLNLAYSFASPPSTFGVPGSTDAGDSLAFTVKVLVPKV